MRAPAWIETAVRDFARAAGIGNFGFSDRGAAALKFENGITLRFEYADGGLAMVATVPSSNDPITVKRLLTYAHPLSRTGGAIRAGYLTKTGCAVFAVRLPDESVTLPALNNAFDALWRVATEFGGAA